MGRTSWQAYHPAEMHTLLENPHIVPAVSRPSLLSPTPQRTTHPSHAQKQNYGHCSQTSSPRQQHVWLCTRSPNDSQGGLLDSQYQNPQTQQDCQQHPDWQKTEQSHWQLQLDHMVLSQDEPGTQDPSSKVLKTSAPQLPTLGRPDQQGWARHSSGTIDWDQSDPGSLLLC